jgi:DivIVA domain-containing protein
MADLDGHEDEAAPDQQPEATAKLEGDETRSIVDRIRSASFGTARRGYDRRQVDDFLARVVHRLESEPVAFDPDIVKRRLEEVGESTTGILTAAEETARKLQGEASADAQRLREAATEAAEQLRSEAKEFAEATREKASEEARRLRMDATRKAEEIIGSAEARAEELLERSLERRTVLDANIERLLDRRAEIADRLRELAAELQGLADDQPQAPPDEPQPEGEDPEPTRPIRDVSDFGFDDEDGDETAVFPAPE